MAVRSSTTPLPPATSTRAAECSATTATGETWSRSAGTSSPSRGTAGSVTCSATPLTRSARAPSGSPATSASRAEADGVVEAWIAFETAVGRGAGHLRLRNGKAWTLLTTLDELKGHEEPASERRPKGSSTARTRIGRPGWSNAGRGGGARHHDASRTASSSAAARAASHSAPGCASSASRRSSSSGNARPGDSWRNRYKSLCLHDPVWYDHLPYVASRRTGRCSHRRTRSPTGSRCTRRSWSSTTGLHRVHERDLRRDGAGVAGRRRA